MSTNTKTNDILLGLNRFNTAKNTDAWVNDELSNIIINISSLYSKMIEAGKISIEQAQEFYDNYLSHFTGDHKDDFFTLSHENLDLAAKTMNQDIAMASYKSNSIINFTTSSYNKGMKKAS